MALFGKKKESINPLGMAPPAGRMPQDNSFPPDMGMPQQGQGMEQMQDPNYEQQNYYNQQPDGQDMGMPPPPSPMEDMNYQQDMGMPQQGQGMGQMQYDQSMNNNQPNFPEPQFDQQFPVDDTKERVEEIAEAIIDEKWNNLVKDINKVIEWKERTDNEIKRIEQEIINLKERFESLHKGVLGKITEYDQNLVNVGTEIKAMDMAFKKILPTFTENVNKLDRFVNRVGSSK